MNVRKKFKSIYKAEFDDPNEVFQDFLFSLIPKKKLINIIKKGKTNCRKLLGKFV